MGKVAFVWDPEFMKYDFGPAHPLRPERYLLTHRLCQMAGIFDSHTVQVVPARKATREELSLVHSDDYLDLVERLSGTGSGLLDFGDTPAFKNMYDVASTLVGGSLEAADLVMNGQYAHAFNIAGGFHHASSSRAAGFCIFNDVAITARYLLEKYGMRRVLVLDVDAHHGDGTQWSLYDEPRTLKIDFHESGLYLYPGSGFIEEIGKGGGRGYMVNLPFPPRTGTDAYLLAFREIVEPLVKAFKPEVIVQQTGADGHRDDLLASLGLTTRAYYEITRAMRSLSHEFSSDRYILLGGGGYNAASVARIWTLVTAALAGLDLPDEVPDAWRNEFRSLLSYDPPATYFDEVDKDTAELGRKSLSNELEKMIREVKQTIFPLHNLAVG